MAILGVTGMEGLMLGKLTFTIPTRIKKRVLFVALVFLAVWPILHHGIVTTYDMDPWLYFGLSMYARPRPILGVIALQAAYPGESFRSVNPDALPADSPLRRNIRMLTDGRAWYGTLHNPEPVVKEMFDAFPRDIDRVSFTMRVLKLNSKGILVAKDTRSECRKGKERDNVECAMVPLVSKHPPGPQ